MSLAKKDLMPVQRALALIITRGHLEPRTRDAVEALRARVQSARAPGMDARHHLRRGEVEAREFLTTETAP